MNDGPYKKYVTIVLGAIFVNIFYILCLHSTFSFDFECSLKKKLFHIFLF